jgi:hypothetical protein
MNDFLNNIIKTKIATMILLGVLYCISIYLISGTGDILSIDGIIGFSILCLATVLSIVAFLDYRHKETTDAAISQMEIVVSSLAKALEASANTNITSEKVREQTLKSTKIEG